MGNMEEQDEKKDVGKITLLTKTEKAEELGVDIRTITNMIKRGTIEWTRIGKRKRRWFFPKKFDGQS